MSFSSLPCRIFVGIVVTSFASPPFASTWFRSKASDVNLTTTMNGTLLWQSPKHFSGIFNYLPSPLSVANKGDTINVSMRWRSSGDNLCPSSCFADGNYCQSSSCQALKCASKSVNCLDGTGDFRIALLDTSHATGKVTRDDWCPSGSGYGDMTKCVEGEPFADMRGYDWRVFPHLTANAKHEPGQVPCSIYRKSSANVFGKHPRLGEWGCFGTPLDEWTELNLFIKRRDSKKFEVGMSMNGITYEASDEIEPTDPTAISQVDAIAIGYPNGRHYTYVELGAVSADGNGDIHVLI